MVRYTMEEAKASFEDLMTHVRAEEVIRVQAVPSRLGAMRGTIKIIGDIVAPLDEPWEVLQ